MTAPLQDHELKWFAVDLDNTLATQIWPKPGVGKPIAENIEKLRDVAAAGYSIIIFTARHWADYVMIEGWLDANSIPYKQIICGKPLVHRFVDDKAVNASAPTWL